MVKVNTRSEFNIGSQVLLKEVISSVNLKNKNEIQSFIQEHPGFNILLQNVVAQLRVYFPQESLTLEYRTNPEDPLDPAWLSLKITNFTSLEEAKNKLERFEEEFWMSESSSLYNIGITLLINLAFLV